METTAHMGDVHHVVHAAVGDDMRAVRVIDDQLAAVDGAVQQRRRDIIKLSIFVCIANARGGNLRVARLNLLEQEIPSESSTHVSRAADQMAWMAESRRRCQEAVHLRGPILRVASSGLCPVEEHACVTHADVAFQLMDFPQIEIDKPWAVGDFIVAVLCIIAVRQTAVEAEMRPFRIDGTAPRFLLQQHDFAEGVEDLRERPSARHAPIVVATPPRCYGCMDVAVCSAEMEFLLDDWRQFFAIFNGAQRLWRVTTGPCMLQLVVRCSRHHVCTPIFVHGSEIRKVVVRPIVESERVLHVARVVVKTLVTAFFRSGFDTECETFAIVTPAVFMIAHETMAQAVPPKCIPILFIFFADAGRIICPQHFACHMFPWRFWIRDVRQMLFEIWANGHEETFIDIVAFAVGLRNVGDAAVHPSHSRLGGWRAQYRARVGKIPVRMTGYENRRVACLRHDNGGCDAAAVRIVRNAYILHVCKPCDAAVRDSANLAAFCDSVDNQRFAT